MKNLKVKKMIIVLFVAIVMVTISTEALATELVNPINILTNSQITETPAPQTNVVAPITNTEGTDTKLPQTGDASDYAIFLAIALFIVVSIYAYKKVKEYNNI